MIKVIKNGTVITMDEKRENKYEKLDIVIDGNIIKEIVSDYNGYYDELIDATDKVVMPGLINAHNHLGMSFFRATNDDLTLNEWLQNKIWPIEDNLSVDDIYYGSLLSCIEMIKTGTVMANDMYFNYEGTIKALKESKMRCLFSNTLMSQNGEERINILRKIYNELKDDELIKVSVSVHAFYTSDKEYLKKCSDLALELDLPLHIHFCENKGEVDGIVKDYGSISNALIETGMTRNRLILAHTTFIDDECLELLKNCDVSFVHNPVSNLNLGCGISDITKYRNYVNVCLGTDGQGSGNNLNLFYHMSFVDFLQKGLYQNPTVFSSYDVLKMATINGAKALGVDDIIGSIEVGKCADIIILDLGNIEVYPTVDLIVNVCHNVESSNVDTTIINGEVLMRNHKLLLDISEDDLKKNVSRIIDEKLANMEKYVK